MTNGPDLKKIVQTVASEAALEFQAEIDKIAKEDYFLDLLQKSVLVGFKKVGLKIDKASEEDIKKVAKPIAKIGFVEKLKEFLPESARK